MSHKNVLYIGNDLTKKTKYNSTLAVLSLLLTKEGFSIKKSSNKSNKIHRLLDMCFSVIKFRKSTDYILIDTYSTTNFYYALITSQLARLFNIKYIPILHGGNLPYRLSKSSKLSQLIFKNSYKNVAPSHYLKNAFEKAGFSTIYIPNTLEIDLYPFKHRKTIKPKLLWVRAFKEIYNPVMAIEVLSLLKKKYANASLCMIGPFVDDTHLQAKLLVKKLQLKGSVEFTGVLLKEDWHKKSEEFDIFINTTNFDNTPVSVMEAMALGLPVVSTNVGGIPYLIQENYDGLLVAKSNPKEMAIAILHILDQRFPEISLMARKKVEKFDWNVVKYKWLEILK